ncbi:PP2C family protein-serine/threonine phosphatase [Streptomyces sp. NPDC008343]|uniref:PP2C family protein-serine/threonine phosphatase n=1 Tax=Streptomyces sp. NPDC008343 TaxID=3364828 RepID=UPI0036E45998
MISTTQDATTAARLVEAIRAAVMDASAAAGIIYLPTPGGAWLRAAALGGSAPEVFVLMESMPSDAPYASATSWRTGMLSVIGEPPSAEVVDVGLHRLTLPHPYSVAATAITDPAGARLGALTVVRVPTRDGPLTPGHYARLRAAGEALGRDLTGVPLIPPPRPVVFPIFGGGRAVDSGWEFPAVPGTGGLSMMYVIHKLYPALSGARTTAEVAATVRERIMEPLGAESLILTIVHDGRLWVVGHTASPPGAVRKIHGSPADSGNPAAHVLTGHPLFTNADDLARIYPDTPLAAQPSWAVLPLTAYNRAVGSLLLGWSSPRQISPEEQGLLGMLGSLLGPALDSAHRAEAEHALAESVQTRLLPVLPDLPDVVTTGRYLPAPASDGADITAGAGVGGDWYDVLPLPGGRIALVAGDVEGHGYRPQR